MLPLVPSQTWWSEDSEAPQREAPWLAFVHKEQGTWFVSTPQKALALSTAQQDVQRVEPHRASSQGTRTPFRLPFNPTIRSLHVLFLLSGAHFPFICPADSIHSSGKLRSRKWVILARGQAPVPPSTKPQVPVAFLHSTCQSRVVGEPWFSLHLSPHLLGCVPCTSPLWQTTAFPEARPWGPTLGG